MSLINFRAALKAYILVLLVCFVFPEDALGDAKGDAKLLAQAMREVSRRKDIKSWPECITGTPGPKFPSDTFYLADCEDPERTVELVQSIVSVLVENNESFLKEFSAIGSLDEVKGRDMSDPIGVFTLEALLDGAGELSVSNRSNYLKSLLNGVRKLKFRPVGCDFSDRRSALIGTFMVTEEYPYDFNIILDEFQYNWYDGGWPHIPIMRSYVYWNYTEVDWDEWELYCVSGRVRVDVEGLKGKLSVYVALDGDDYSAAGSPSYNRGGPFDVDKKFNSICEGKVLDGSDTYWYSEVYGEDVPVDGVDVGVFSNNWYFAASVAFLEIDLGDEDIDSLDCCDSCTSTCTPGKGTGGLGSLSYQISLGAASPRKSAGNLFLHSEGPSLKLATPDSIRTSLNEDVTEVIRGDEGELLQVVAPQVLVDFVIINDFKYEMRFYHRGEEDWDYFASRYEPVGTPFKVTVVENPDASEETFNRLKITEIEDSKSEVIEFAYDELANSWTLVTGDGLRKESLAKVWNLAKTERTETRTVKNASNVVVSKTVEVYFVFPWGEELISRVEDPDGAALTSTWSFYDDEVADGEQYGKEKLHIDANGFWERSVYDSSGRLWKKVSQHLGASSSAAESASRVHTYTYSLDGLTETVVETLLGQEVSRNYRVFSTSGNIRERRDIASTVAGASVSASTNLVTITRKNKDDHRVQSVRRPDGTMTIYSYEGWDDDGEKVTVSEGQPNSGGTAVIKGTRTETITDRFKHVISVEKYDIESDLLLSSAYTTATDDFGRPTRTDYDDGTFELIDYDCCGIASRTERDGTATAYIHDALERVVAEESSNGMATLFSHDAEGRTLQVKRRGTDDSLITLNTSEYDLAGRLKKSWNALGDLTTYGYSVDSSGNNVKTTTNPDSSTVIETTYPDGNLKSITGTAVHPVEYEYGVDSNGAFTKEIRVTASGSGEWTKTYTDLAGRTSKIVKSGGATTDFFYNAIGQLIKEIDPDGVVKLYQYNSEGEVEYTAIDMNRNGVIDLGGTDRVTRTQHAVTTRSSETVQETTQSVYGPSGEIVVSVNATTPNGRKTWQTQYGLTTQSQTVFNGSGQRTQTVTRPDGTYSVTVSNNGQITSQINYASNNTQIGASSMSYDPHGRMISATDARNGTTTYTYTNLDQIASVTTPNPGSGGSAQTTGYQYDSMGRRLKVILPDSSETVSTYYPTGELKTNSGSQTYSVEYGYDLQGRLKTLKTNGQAGNAITTWNYDTSTGLLTSKVYPDSKGPSYTYTDAGRLATRTWARGIVTTYTYDNAGDLASVSYSDSTPGITYTRNRLGLVTSVTDVTGTRALTYTDDGQPETESWDNGMFEGVVNTLAYDTLHRRASLSLAISGSSIFTHSHTYDNAGRLGTVSDGTHTATYGYVANSSLVGSVTMATSGTAVITTTKTYDNLNRLTNISNTRTQTSEVVSSYTYQLNNLNQRTKQTMVDGSYWVYQYDTLGQVTSGKKYWPDHTEVAGQQFGYAFDGIGNRTSTTTNGRTANYVANALNQYTSREVPGAVDIIGSAKSDATVTVNNQPTSRKGDYFYKALSVDNDTAPAYPEITVVGVKNNVGENGEDAVTTKTGHIYVEKTPDVSTYDDDGNLTADGRWSYTWDGENRLIGMTAISATPMEAKKKLDFRYDYIGRRVEKVVYDWSSSTSAYEETSKLKFIYDGWNLSAETEVDLVFTRSYVWGSDLSGGNAAGGVGGLLFIKRYPEKNTYSVAYDGQGNVSEILNFEPDLKNFSLKYGPFGEVLESNDVIESKDRIGFSSKYMDSETDFLYYGLRYYSPQLGGWLNRDPIGEIGALGLYQMNFNNPVGYIDFLGLNALDYSNGITAGESFKYSVTMQDKFQGPLSPDEPIDGGTTNLEWMIDLIFDKESLSLKINSASCKGEYFYLNEGAKMHELVHVNDHRAAWGIYFGYAEEMIGPCKSQEEADCYKSALMKYKLAFARIRSVVSAFRHSGSDPITKYPDSPSPNSPFKRQRKFFDKQKPQAISLLMAARIEHGKCDKKYRKSDKAIDYRALEMQLESIYKPF